MQQGESVETGAGSSSWTVKVGWQFLVVPVWKYVGAGKRNQVCGQLGQELDGQGAPMGADWATSHV